MSVSVFVCGPGCCAGCSDCFGMSLGCHQAPCRCDLPCVCRYELEDEDPGWRNGCQRHDNSNDQRQYEMAEPEWSPVDNVPSVPPCPVCGEGWACGYDAEGRPLYHPLPEDDDL